jgi:hypothetical protein
MVRIAGFKFAVAAALAASLTTLPALPGASATHYSSPRQTSPAGLHSRQHRRSQDGQPVANVTNPPAALPPILWRDPVDIEGRDLFYGIGGPEGAPDPSAPFTYVRRKKSGTQKKIIVKDAHGREWTVKFGPEARPETVATRIVWAAGFHVDQDYFVPRARITGEQNIDARNVRFERRDDGFKEVGNWAWERNPFLGTRELDGLRVLMALLKNWDLAERNNDIKTPKEEPGPQIYYVADLGATFGRTGTFLNSLYGNAPATVSFSPGKAKGDPYAFTKERFIKEVRGGHVYFNMRHSYSRNSVNGVSVATARWMGALLGRLSDKQLADAFRAGGYNNSETALLVSVMRARITQLQRL